MLPACSFSLECKLTTHALMKTPNHLHGRNYQMKTTTKATNLPLIQSIISQLDDLPQESLQEILNHVESLKPNHPKRGSAEALLTCAGTWVFDEGEREMLEKEIQAMRDVIDE
jgi:hypothetical protein